MQRASSARLLPSLSPLGWSAVLAAFLSPVAFSPLVRAPFFAPKYAILLVVAGLGLPLLVGLAVHDPVARIGVGLVAWAALSVGMNPQPVISILGHWNVGTGFLFVVGSLGGWAIGRALTERDARYVRLAVVIAAIVVAVGTIASSALDLRAAGLGAIGGRPVSLTGNPVHSGAFMVAALVLLPARWRFGRASAAAVLAAVLSIGGLVGLAAGLSGSRVAVLGAAVALVGLFRRNRTRAVAVAGMLAAGIIAAQLWSPTVGDDPVGRRPDAATRLVAEGAGGADRVPTWRLAVDATLDRPLVGRGPGRFLEATTPFRAPDTGLVAPDFYFADAHNVILEASTTLGIPGALLLVAFTVLAARRARGPLAWFCVALIPHALLQPLTVAVTPVLLIALGAASRRDQEPRSSRLRHAAAVGAIAGAMVGIIVIAGSVFLERTYTYFRRSDAVRAERLLPPWPEAALGRAQPAAFRSSPSTPEAVSEGIAWYSEAAARNPADPKNLLLLADYEVSYGRFDAAEAHYRAALRRDPISARAHRGMAIVAIREGREQEARSWLDRALRIWPNDRKSAALRRQLLENEPSGDR